MERSGYWDSSSGYAGPLPSSSDGADKACYSPAMPDRLFYPLCLIVAAGMIALALVWPGVQAA
jgi:hypothetical protein